MAAAAPSHYIRSIHTSFAANAHAAPVWATRKDVQYQYQPSINSHNQHAYTHHLQYQNPVYAPQVIRRKPSGGMNIAPGPAVVGRRRSASIRMPPSYVPAARGRATTKAAYKFDPFGEDDAAPLAVMSPLSNSAQANRGGQEQQQPQQLQQQWAAAAPYTIHIPAAQPTEIERYTPPPSPRPAARTTALRSLIPINGPLPGTAPTVTAASTTLEKTAPPASPLNTLSRSPSPPQMGAPRPLSQNSPNLSKIVAGILLNRVHAVGKPMRRRVLPRVEEEKGYRKSSLSSVVSVEM